MKKICHVWAAGVYEWVQFVADPNKNSESSRFKYFLFDIGLGLIELKGIFFALVEVCALL